MEEGSILGIPRIDGSPILDKQRHGPPIKAALR